MFQFEKIRSWDKNDSGDGLGIVWNGWKVGINDGDEEKNDSRSDCDHISCLGYL